jgi:hypothetical protein
MLEALEMLDSRKIDYLPSPCEIDMACSTIRKSWTMSERRRRFVGPHLPDELPQPWQPPLVDTSGLRLAMSRLSSE